MKEKPYQKLLKSARASMKELSKRKDNKITKAGKGGAVVFVDLKDYIKEAERQLNNTENYKKTSRRPNSNKHKIRK